MRKVIFWLHLAVGITAGTVVLLMAVTGMLLAFERQIVEWAERDLRTIPPAGAAALSPEQLLAAASVAQSGAAPAGLTLRADPAAPATVSFGRETTIFLNPYTGAVLGEGAKSLRAFFHFTTDLHRFLALEGVRRDTGRAITGACNLAFLGLIVTGLYLWWPRRWTLAGLRAVTVPSGQLRGKARDFNWHNAFGFWAAPVLFFIVLTGALISYPWATNLLYRMTGNEPPPPRTQAGGPQRGGRSASVSWEGLDRLWSRAAQQVTGWELISARFGAAPGAPVVFMIDRGHRGRPDLRGMLTLDAKSAEVVKWEPFESYNRGRQLRTWGRWIHTGEAGGITGQIIAAFATTAAAVLVWTGFALSWRRFFSRRKILPPTVVAERRDVVEVP